MEYLYHFTAVEYLDFIADDGFLKLTPSNLKKPKHPYWTTNKHGYKVLADETDGYKPVVWLTSNPSPLVRENGLIVSKIGARITVKKSDNYKAWQDWALKNHMDFKWYKALTHGCDFKSWWISENPISWDDFENIELFDYSDNTYKDLNYWEEHLTAKV